jgi:hypothetical protein
MVTQEAELYKQGNEELAQRQKCLGCGTEYVQEGWSVVTMKCELTVLE